MERILPDSVTIQAWGDSEWDSRQVDEFTQKGTHVYTRH
jgi:hypothetical protein